MGLEGVVEVEATIEQADDAIVAADHHPPSAARAALDSPAHLLRYPIRFPAAFLLEELEFPPLVHYACRERKRERWDGSGFAGWLIRKF